MYDDPTLDNPTEAQPWEPEGPAPGYGPGYPGYVPAPWSPSYEPGSNWNNGVAPTPTDPYQNYNGGSPVNAPLQAGHGWTWSGPQAPTWNMTSNNWDQGSWGQTAGSGIGYQAPTNTPVPPGPAPPSPGPGAVAPMPAAGSGITVPGSGLPQNIQNLFNTHPDPTSVQSAYQTALLNYLSQAQTTPSLEDPMLAGQVEVFRAANQRNMERQRRVAVERGSATGQGNSGYIDNQIKKGEADRGFNEAQFNSQLLGGEFVRRRNELQAALHLARQTGDAEAQRALQEKLAQISAMMQQQGLNLQGQLGQGSLDLGWASLGANTALSLEQLNQQAVQMIGNGTR